MDLDLNKTTYKRKFFPFFAKIKEMGPFNINRLYEEMLRAEKIMSDKSWKDLEQTGIYHTLCNQHELLHDLFKADKSFLKEKNTENQYNQYQQFSLTEYNKEKYGKTHIKKIDQAPKDRIKRYKKNMLSEFSRKHTWIPEEDERCYNKLRHFTEELPYTLSIIKKFKAPQGRTRYARLMPGGKILPHIDYDTNYALRFHIALKTNQETYIMIRRNHKSPWIKYHVPADGYAYWLNTGYSHMAINNGKEPRWHLIIGTNGQEDILPLLKNDILQK